MFSPTTFPCSAWYVTGVLNILRFELEGPTGGAPGWFTPKHHLAILSAEHLFSSREAACAEAQKREDARKKGGAA